MKDPNILSQIFNTDHRFISCLKYLFDCMSNMAKPHQIKWFENVNYVYDFYIKNFAEFASMSPTIHKLLIHGWNIIESLDFGPGTYTEQSQECMNKIIRKTRDCYARKMSFIENMQDLANNLYVRSDPAIRNCKID